MSENIIWKQIKQNLQKKFQGKLLVSVLDKAVLESCFLKGQKSFVLKVPSSFHQKILKDHLPSIQACLKDQGFCSNPLRIKKTQEEEKEEPQSPLYIKPAEAPKAPVFSEQWTFHSFIQGPKTSFAFHLAKSVALNPFQGPANPLFIHGPSGIGKTHLLHAIGHLVETKNPSLKVRYLPAERFFNDCINHIRKNEMDLFRQKYRQNINILLLDDVQILGKGESIQEEFFHTFESLKQKGAQIVLASDQRPCHIKGLKDRIKTRFEGGVTAEMESPDRDTKIAIIKNKCRKYQIKLSEEIIFHIADIPTRSVRELEGHLNKIKMFCELQKKKISLSLVQNLFKDTFLPDLSLETNPASPAFDLSPKARQIKLIQKEVCCYFHIKLSELKSAARSQNLVQARNIAMYISRKTLKLSLSEIGWHFGKRNHSTVLNSLKKLEDKQNKNNKTACDIKHLQNLIHKKIKNC